jgi:flagella basal body P-ring formation protein FlgA
VSVAFILGLLIFFSSPQPSVGASASGPGDRVPDAGAVLEAVRGHVAAMLPWADAGKEVQIAGELRPVDLPSGALVYRVAEKNPLSSFRNWMVLMEAAGADGSRRTFWVTVNVVVRARVVTAARRLPYGRRLTEADLALALRELKDPKSEYFRDVREVAGMTLRRSITDGDPLTRAAVTNPVLVRVGDTVRLVLSKPGVQLSTLARAEQAGKLGAVVRVRNLDSSRPVSALVTGEKEVQVN